MRKLYFALVVAAAVGCNGPDEVSPGALDASAAVDAALDADPQVDLTALDPTFGGRGYVETSQGAATALLTDATGGVIACGRLPTGSGRLSRLDRDGALDPSFGTDGVVLLGYACNDLARLRDGRLAALSSDAVRLYTPAGVLLQDVHPAPRASPDSGPYLYALAPLADGGFAVLMAIDHVEPPVHTANLRIVRYDATGAPVATFGIGGEAAVVDGVHTTYPVAAGLVVVPGPPARLAVLFGLWRWAVDLDTGVVDPAWHTDETVNVGSWGHPLAVLGTDRAVVAGYDGPHDQLVVLAWNGAGTTRTTIPLCQPHGHAGPVAMAFDHQGRAVIASAYGGVGDELVVSRLRPDLGGLDPAWGCERRAAFPPDCTPTGCTGEVEERKVYAVGLAITSADDVVIGGGRHIPNRPGAWLLSRFSH